MNSFKNMSHLPIRVARANFEKHKLIALIRLYQICAFLCAQTSALAAISINACIVLLGALVAMHIQFVVHEALILFFGIILLAQFFVSVFVFFVLAVSKWVSPIKAAIEIERSFQHLSGRLSSGVGLALSKIKHDGISDVLIHAAISDALRALQCVQWLKPLRERLGKAFMNIAVAIALWCLALIWVVIERTTPTELIAPFVVAYNSLEFKRHGKLVFEGLQNTVLRGSSVRVCVRAYGGVPKEVWLRVLSKGKRYDTKMQQVSKSHLKPIFAKHLQFNNGVLYEISLRNIRNDIRIAAFSDGIWSKWHLIRVVDPLMVRAVKVSVEPPLYTGLEPREITIGLNPTVITAPYGSLLSISVQCNNRLVEALAHRNGAQPLKMAVNGSLASLELEAKSSVSIGVELKDSFGFSKRWSGIQLRVLKDMPPSVNILAPEEQDVPVLPYASVPVVVEASDDYGLDKLKVVFSGSVPRREVELGSYSGTEKKVTTSLLIHIAGLKVGDVIRFRAVATDNDELLGPKMSISQWRSIRVVTMDEFLSSAWQLEKRVEEKLREVVEQYEKALRTLTGVAERIKHALKPSGSDVRCINEILCRLESVRKELSKASEEMETHVRTARLNQIASSIEWLNEWLRQFLYEGIGEDVTMLNRLKEVLKRGKTDAEQFLRLVKHMDQVSQSEVRNALMVIQRVRNFSELLKTVLKSAEAAHQFAALKTQLEGLPQEKFTTVAKALSKQLSELKERFKKFTDALKAIAKRWENEKELATILVNAFNELSALEVERALAEASEALLKNPQDADAKLTTASRAVNSFVEALKETYERMRLQAYRSDRDKLAEVWSLTEKLAREQRTVMRLTKDAQMKHSIKEMKLTELIERQLKLSKKSQKLLEQLVELRKLIPQLSMRLVRNARGASEAKARAFTMLNFGDLLKATKAQAEAISNLEQLLSGLSSVFHYSYGVASQIAGIAQMEMLDLASLQERINLQSNRLSLKDRQLRQLMATYELMIRAALKRADNLFGVPWSAELREFVHKAQSDALDIASAIERGNLNEEIRMKQEHVLIALLKLANELSGIPQAMSEMQATQKLALGQKKKQGRGEGEEKEGGRERGKGEDWREWLRSLPDSLFGRFVEHGPPMKSVPEALAMQSPQRAYAPTQGRRTKASQQVQSTVQLSAPAPYRNAVTIYFKRVGGR
ncbi:MAG: hypothetical protein RUDDFDWM_000923 [Candidatus Fervidibacterota bacterium]